LIGKRRRAKLDRVTAAFTTVADRDALADVIAALDKCPVTALTSLLANIRPRANAPDINHEPRGET
jgi:hypothetical protein